MHAENIYSIGYTFYLLNFFFLHVGRTLRAHIGQKWMGIHKKLAYWTQNKNTVIWGNRSSETGIRDEFQYYVKLGRHLVLTYWRIYSQTGRMAWDRTHCHIVKKRPAIRHHWRRHFVFYLLTLMHIMHCIHILVVMEISKFIFIIETTPPIIRNSQ